MVTGEYPVDLMPQWKELSNAMRQLHQTVINSTIVEAGGTTFSPPTSACNPSDNHGIQATGVNLESYSNSQPTESSSTTIEKASCLGNGGDCLLRSSLKAETESSNCSNMLSNEMAKVQLSSSCACCESANCSHSCTAASDFSKNPPVSSQQCMSTDDHAIEKSSMNSIDQCCESSSPKCSESSDFCTTKATLSDVANRVSASFEDANLIISGPHTPATLELPTASHPTTSQDSSTAVAATISDPMIPCSDTDVPLHTTPSNSHAFSTCAVIPRTHTVKISSPVFQRPSIDRIKNLVEE